jgi:hypothetical protein
MPETIRENIRRRVGWLSAIGMAGLLAGLVSLVVIANTEPRAPISTIGFAGLGVSVVAFAGAFLTALGIRCPRCHRRIGIRALLRTECRYCGVNLDEPCA